VAVRAEDFDFELPASQIAQSPSKERDASRLLVLDRSSGRLEHRLFRDLPELLRPSDLLVLNDTQVIPARLCGVKRASGGKAELLLVRPALAAGDGIAVALAEAADAQEWICLGQASKGFQPGARIDLEAGNSAEILERLGEGRYRVRFSSPRSGTLARLLETAGRVPLPPYIDREPAELDRERYQTVYAERPGSVAAPTAGLHFTTKLLEALAARGIRSVRLTLEVGPGTFLPVRGDLERHSMHSERYFVPRPSAACVEEAKTRGQRVVAVGTTVVRALESAIDPLGKLREGAGETMLFIRPGFVFRKVDALITNFHLPQSTLLMLVSAFSGRETILRAYRQAVERQYRFFSYGDAMLIE
jgi:S-adenosylmethionine:tRNA ribosyltransferase-isomerase